MGERTERVHGKRIGGQCTQPQHLPGVEGEREAHKGEEQSGGTPARTVPGSQSRPSAADGAHWVLTLGPSRILTVPAVPSPCWPPLLSTPPGTLDRPSLPSVPSALSPLLSGVHPA